MNHTAWRKYDLEDKEPIMYWTVVNKCDHAVRWCLVWARRCSADYLYSGYRVEFDRDLYLGCPETVPFIYVLSPEIKVESRFRSMTNRSQKVWACLTSLTKKRGDRRRV